MFATANSDWKLLFPCSYFNNHVCNQLFRLQKFDRKTVENWSLILEIKIAMLKPVARRLKILSGNKSVAMRLQICNRRSDHKFLVVNFKLLHICYNVVVNLQREKKVFLLVALIPFFYYQSTHLGHI